MWESQAGDKKVRQESKRERSKTTDGRERERHTHNETWSETHNETGTWRETATEKEREKRERWGVALTSQVQVLTWPLLLRAF